MTYSQYYHIPPRTLSALFCVGVCVGVHAEGIRNETVCSKHATTTTKYNEVILVCQLESAHARAVNSQYSSQFGVKESVTKFGFRYFHDESRRRKTRYYFFSSPSLDEPPPPCRPGRNILCFFPRVGLPRLVTSFVTSTPAPG